KSKMWVYRSIGLEGLPPVVIFEYQPGRAGSYAASFLKGFTGSLMSDYSDKKVIPIISSEALIFHNASNVLSAFLKPDRKAS
ncbi:MAG: transposase, partial [Peptostreptococcaceae bacterium]|nr:transposase [Peptostreptococcaceae bacterium]